MATIAACAKHVGLTERRVYELIEVGVVERAPKGKRGGYDLDEFRLAYIQHLRDQAAGRGEGPGEDPNIPKLETERALRQKTLRERDEIRTAQLKGEVLPADEVADAISQAITVMKQRLLGIPAKLAKRLAAQKQPAKCEQLMRDDIAKALGELSRVNVKG